MLICICCNELNTYGKQVNTYVSKTTMFRVFETLTREVKDLLYDEVYAYMNSGKANIKNLEIKEDKIKGNGIDIARFYRQPTDKLKLAIVFNKVMHIRGHLFGYDIVTQDGNVIFAPPEQLMRIMQSSYRVINATIANGGIKLISLSGIGERTFSGRKNDQGGISDIDGEITLGRAIKLLTVSGFKPGYTKSYRGEVAGNMTDCAIGIYYKDSTVIWFNIDTKSPYDYLNSPGGKMIAQARGNGNGNSNGLYTSKFEIGHSNDFITVDTFQGGGVLKASREFNEDKTPVEYFLDNLGEIPEEFSITTLDIRYTEAVLRDKYFGMEDDLGKDYITYLFIQNEYGKFDKGLKALYKHLRKYSREMLTDKVIKDIKKLGGNQSAVKKVRNYLTELLQSFPNTDYSFKNDVEPFLKSTTMNTNNKGIKGLMQMFKR